MIKMILYKNLPNRMRRLMGILLLLMDCFLSPIDAFCLENKAVFTISGTVSDDGNEPLVGASIVLEGTTKGTITDGNGNYKLELTDADKKGTLVFSFVGFDQQRVSIDGRSFISITLKEGGALKEVVIIGYGTVNKRDLTGSVGKVEMEELLKAPVSSFDQALGGRVAGLVVSSNDGQPGAASQISIRGSSYSQDASPLFVIDGFPIENMDINSINPQDIESLDVLKDASSIAIYGSRAANGVILITTKKGKTGQPKLTYNASYGIQRVTKKVDVLSPYEFVKLQLELDAIASTPSAKSTKFASIYLDEAKGINLESYRQDKGYNWQDLLLSDGRINSHNLNLTGGSNGTRYAISGSYFDQKGVILNTGLTRYNGKFTFDQELRKNITIGVSANYASSTNYGTSPTSTNGGGVVQGMWQYRPTNGPKSQDLLNAIGDSIALVDFYNGTSTTTIGDNLVNPILQAQNELRQNRQNTALINAFVEYRFLKNFKFRASGGLTTTDNKYSTYYNSKTQQGNLFVNAAGSMPNTIGINGSITNVSVRNYLAENVLTYTPKLGKHHSLSIVGGFTYQFAESSFSGFRSVNIPQSQEVLVLDGLGSGIGNSPTSGRQHNQMYSFLSRANYSLFDRYLFTLTGRSDGSSKFAVGKQWGYFPSGAFAWKFDQEPILKGKIKKILSEGKLRVSYGLIGNNKVNDVNYAWAGSVNAASGYPGANGQYLAGYVPFFYANPDLTWETTKEFDLGVNLGFFKNRIAIEADYYDRKTTDFLMSVTLPALAGYNNGLNQQYQNTGAVRNRGFEFTLTTKNVDRKDFKWQTNFNISFNQGTIEKFYGNIRSIGSNWGLTGTAQAWIAEVGGPLSQYYGYKADGLFQYSDFDKLANGTYVLKNGIPTYAAAVQPGDQKYKDLNGDGIIDANDQTTLGSYQPKHTGGITNNFTFKNITLSVFGQWRYGGQVMNVNRVAFETTGSYFGNGNQFATYANRWTPTNTDTDIPKARVNTKGDLSGNNPKPSSRFIEDGSFFRLKTIQLNYNLPKAMLKRAKMSNASVFVSAQNLYTWTNYSGLDPEVSSFRAQNSSNSPIQNTGNTAPGVGYSYIQPSAGTPVLTQGYDYTPYPRAITVTAGLTVVF